MVTSLSPFTSVSHCEMYVRFSPQVIGTNENVHIYSASLNPNNPLNMLLPVKESNT